MRPIRTLLAAAVLTGVGAGLADIALAQSGLVVPRVVTRPQPPVPTNSAGQTIDGWAIVRYTVLTDGSTSDIRVLDVLPPAVDPAPTIEAVRQWTFTPGTRDGEPIDWHNTESVVVFQPNAESVPPSDRFLEEFEAIGSLLDEESYGDALSQNEELLDRAETRVEIGLALAQQAIIHQALTDMQSALAAIRLATDPRIPSLPLDELLSGLYLRFLSEAQLGRRKEALDTFQRISFALGPGEENPFAGVADDLSREWETVETLPVAGRVDDKPWRINAARRTFTIASIDGEISGIDVECDRNATRLDFQQDAEWSLPDSWGNCELFIDGAPGTTFFYYEFLDPQADPG